MRVKIEGEENYSPEIFAMAEKLVWHYGLFNVMNDKMLDLKDRWLDEVGDVEPENQWSRTRILVLAGRSLFYNTHICDESCIGLPESPIAREAKSLSYRCQHCDRPFDPISTRYLCPYPDCKTKNTCCE